MKSLIIIFTIFIASMSSYSQSLSIFTEENAPFNFTKGGKMTGISTEILDATLKDAGMNIPTSKFKVIPWARAYDKVQANKNHVLFSMARTAQREKMFQWVGPIYKLQIGLLAKKGNKISIKSKADLKKYKIGTVIDGAPEQLLLKEGVDKSKLERVSKQDINVKKLKAGRIDMLAFNIPATLYSLEKIGEKSSDYEVVYVLKEVDLYYGLNKNTDKAVVAKLQASFDKLKKSGKTDKIIKKYIK